RLSVGLGSILLVSMFGCGGAATNAPSGASPGASAGGDAPTEAEIAQAQKPCGGADEVHAHDLASGKATEAFAPCSKTGSRDYSALVKVETLDEGVHIIIDATDDEVTILGPEAAQRDAVIVYPKGKGSVGIEVPLMKTKTGYRGDKIVLWEDMGKLTDDGTKIDVAIYDHDHSAQQTEEMHVALAVSAGKSCEKAQDENMQTMNMGAKGAKAADLSDVQLGAPMQTSAFFAGCGLPDSSNADICVAVKRGKPVGVSVALTPSNNKVATCIDRATRHLAFPVSDQLDVVHQKF
ncbi:MAG TPA: hypothetical protein VHV30_04160, partial [Polyangiaceae bacterium]|nr:hypothetical protein [Polyangiaceae bacterium]